jgi:hypothetical protein
MMKANADVNKMTAGEKKTMGMKEMILTKAMMEKKDVTGFKLHLNKAIEMGMSKQFRTPFASVLYQRRVETAPQSK